MNKKLAVTLLFPLMLAACGGGGGDDDDDDGSTAPPGGTPTEPETPPVLDSVTQASLNTATQLGLAPIAGNAASVRVYDVVADIGDTWRLTFNMDTGAYTLKVLHTVYGLTDASGTFTQSASGSFINLIGASGAFTLLIDERTRTIAGAMSLGGRTASVSGSSYAPPTDVSVLAGDYTMLVASHNIPFEPEPGEEPEEVRYELYPGVVRLKADATAILCAEASSIASDDMCESPSGEEGEEPYRSPGIPGKLALNAADGDYHLTITIDDDEVRDLGILRVQAGDFGPVLTLDIPAEDGIEAAGVTYLVKHQVLAGTEVDGTWQCSMAGNSSGTVTINGTSLQWTQASGTSQTSTLAYNAISNPPDSLTFNGLVSVVTVPAAEPDAEEAPAAELTGVILPMSSSVMLFSEVRRTISSSICHRNGS